LILMVLELRRYYGYAEETCPTLFYNSHLFYNPNKAEDCFFKIRIVLGNLGEGRVESISEGSRNQ
jgi:hypothetical protein